MSAFGRLYLLPAPLSPDTPPQAVVPGDVIARIRALDRFVAENAKSTRAWLAACGHPKAMRDIAITELNEHTADRDVPALLDPLLAGHDVGLLSEAGMPAVADPGSALVAAAHARAITVVPCVGPSSILLALAASGLEGQRFRFVGYLPAQAAGRREALLELERRSSRDRETQVFIETPYRNDALLAEALQSLKPGTRLAVAVDITSAQEWIAMDNVAGWRKRGAAIGKRPAIFLVAA
ncbi:MAG TPA: SAM-dependent methyltransferase [Usitatibacter sp.]|nr:SAM-dependent methyltransferase [Usitatibacter sp.]